MMRIALAAVVLALIPARAALANSACGGDEGWSLPENTKIGVKPTLAYYAASYEFPRGAAPALEVKINGKAVKFDAKVVTSNDQSALLVHVLNGGTGKLYIEIVDTHESIEYKITKDKAPDAATATTSRFHVAYQHSTVHELEDGLEIATNVKAVHFVGQWRRDAQSSWTGIDIPAVTRNNKQVAHLGSVGCESNFSVPLLENGVELQLAAVLADGTALPLALPTKVVLPKLDANASQSRP